METSSLGLVEIALGFGGILALAVWELARNRRALARMRRDEGSNGGSDR